MGIKMDKLHLIEATRTVKDLMVENANYLVELDARFGDGDLGISMSQGFQAAVKAMENEKDNEDLGITLKTAANAFNEAAPSTLGTIMSFMIMGMAKTLKGKTDCSIEDVANAMMNGVNMIMEKAKSKPGDKTILDSLYPGVCALKTNIEKGKSIAFGEALKAAEEGLENTKQMKGMHGRIAYYGDKTIGEIDGGAVVGVLIFKALLQYIEK